MSPEKRRRLNTTPHVGFSPFLRSLSRLPLVRKCTTTSSPPLCFNHDNTRKNPSRDPMIQHEVDEDDDDDDEEEEEECEDDSDQTEEEDEELNGETVQVDFGFFDPKPADFHGVKLLIRGYLDDKSWDLSGFVDLIIEQTTVGTVVKSDDEGDEGDGGTNGDGEKKDDDDGLYAVISALNLGRYESHKSIRDIKEYVLGVCKEEALKVKLGLLLGQQAKDVGLLVSERFVNFPNQAVVPLYSGLFDEIGWATEDETTQESRDSFQFKFYLLITKIYMISKERKSRASREEIKVSNKYDRQSHEDEPVVYIKSEDEIFHKLSFINFTYQLHQENVVPPEMKKYRKMGLIMVMESKEVPNFQKELNNIAESLNCWCFL